MEKIEYVGKCLLIEDGEGTKKERVIVIGDLHLGYEGALQESGYAIISKAYEETISDLDKIFESVGKVDKIVILGDIKHEFGRISKDEWRDVGALIDYLEGKLDKNGELIIVKGNHDVIINSITVKKKIFVMDYFIWKEYAFLHGDSEFDEINNKLVKTWVVGHAHPAIVLKEGGGVKSEKYKCFLVGKYKGKKVIVLPSFFPLVEGTDARNGNLGLAWDFDLTNFDVKVVGEGLKVLDFGKLGRIE